MDFLRDERAASLPEYILLTVLIALACLVGLSLFGRVANNRLSNVAEGIAP